jgi:Flp pilus assembly protein TadG
MRLLLHREREGQGLIEAALVLPFLLFIALNAINLGYFFFVYLNLATAPRQGAQYSILGSVTTVNQLPGADAVHQLVNDDIGGAISAASGTPTRVCTLALGTSSPHDSTQVPLCQTYNAGSDPFTPVLADPEAPALVLNRVDIAYTVTPPIPGRVFNLVMPSSLTFHRLVYMRAEQ